MTDSADSSQLLPGDVITQATGIISERFKLGATQALAVLRRMSRSTRMQMCVVAEQMINHDVPVEAARGLETEVLGFASPRKRNHGFDGLHIVAD